MLNLSELIPGMRLDGIDYDVPVIICTVKPDGPADTLSAGEQERMGAENQINHISR